MTEKPEPKPETSDRVRLERVVRPPLVDRLIFATGEVCDTEAAALMREAFHELMAWHQCFPKHQYSPEHNTIVRPGGLAV